MNCSLYTTLTLLKILSSKTQGCKDFKTCHVGSSHVFLNSNFFNVFIEAMYSEQVLCAFSYLYLCLMLI